MVNYIVSTCRPEYKISTADADVINFQQLQDLSSVDYSLSLVPKAIQYGLVKD